VRRDVGRALEATVVSVGRLLGVLRVVQRQLVHVELVRHDVKVMKQSSVYEVR